MAASRSLLGLVLLWLAVGRAGADRACEACTDRDDGSEDLSVLLQRGAPSVSPASVLESHGTSSAMLDSEAKAFSNILTGVTSKSQVEIVLAHYNEDISWSDAYQEIRTVYCKGPKKKRAPGCLHLKNVGREGHTYLKHIVQNYDNLSDWTVFTQAQAPTQGYAGHRLGGGHMLPGVPFDAYVLPEEAGGLPREDGSAFVMTGALHMPTLNHSLRFSFLTARTAPTLHQQSKCPKTEFLDGWQRWWDLGWFKKWIGGKCKIPAKKVPKAFNDYWDKYVKLPRPPHEIIFFSQGARFAASRERIQQRSKAFYEELLELLSHDKDPCHNYFNEWIWFYVIGAPAKGPCDAALVVDEASQDKSWKGSENLLEKMRSMRLKGEDAPKEADEAWLQNQADLEDNLDGWMDKDLDDGAEEDENDPEDDLDADE